MALQTSASWKGSDFPPTGIPEKGQPLANDSWVTNTTTHHTHKNRTTAPYKPWKVLKPGRNTKGYGSQANNRECHLTQPLRMLDKSWQKGACMFFCRCMTCVWCRWVCAPMWVCAHMILLCYCEQHDKHEPLSHQSQGRELFSLQVLREGHGGQIPAHLLRCPLPSTAKWRPIHREASNRSREYMD